jgi:hypothetical protein
MIKRFYKTIYCTAQCSNGRCYRHGSRAPDKSSPSKDPSRWADYSSTCTQFTPNQELAAIWRAVARSR